MAANSIDTPSVTREAVLALIERKDQIESEIFAQKEILRAVSYSTVCGICNFITLLLSPSSPICYHFSSCCRNILFNILYVQWATKVMTLRSIRNTWNQGS